MKKTWLAIITLLTLSTTSLSIILEKIKPIYKNSKELFGLYYTLAEEKLNNMTEEEWISQILLVRVPETNAKEQQEKNQFGGYLFFARDFADLTKEEVINKTKSYQEVSKIPLLTAVDEEGGIVVRISSNPNLRESPFLSSRELYKQGGFSKIKEDTIEKSNLLNSLGINVNLAPVVDISTEETDYMYKRSIGLSAEETAQYVTTVLEASKNLGVSYVLKHFPGYGNNVDTHTGTAKDIRDIETIKNIDLVPFVKGIQNSVESIMISHNIVTAIDEENPASLSSKIHKLLREDLNFTGVIITDDLSMGAIKNIESPFVKAIQAGNDLIITSEPEKTIQEIKKGLQSKEITIEQIKEMAKRVIAWKYYKGLL